MNRPAPLSGCAGIKKADACIAAVLFSLTLFFFTPLQIYLTNRLEFPYVFSLVTPVFVMISFAAAVLLSAVLLVLPVSSRKACVAAIAGASVLIWLQGNVFVWSYGVFDGRQIEWDQFRGRGIIDALAWLSGAALVVFKAQQARAGLRKLAAGLLLIQFISALWTMIQASQLPSAEKVVIDNKNLTRYSSEKNVIILLLDAFETDVFQEIIDEDPAEGGPFQGFTYFRNAVAPFQCTYPAIVTIMTGRYYDNTVEIQRFIKDEFTRRSLPSVLRDRGFTVELYPYFNPYSIYCDPALASNLVVAKKRLRAKDIAHIYDIALFRSCPQQLKKALYRDQRWFIRRLFSRGSGKRSGRFRQDQLPPSQRHEFRETVRFFRETSAGLSLSENMKLFKYIHLPGMHFPLMFNEALEPELLPSDRQGYKKQARGLLKLVSMFLSGLKEAGIYDNSLIVIMGDHGALGDVYLPQEKRGNAGQLYYPGRGGGLPLVLIKPFDASGRMRVSDAAVSLSDIPRTIMSELHLKDDFPGVSMFDEGASEERARKFYAYSWNEQKIKEDYLPVMTEYSISGFSWLAGSWKETGTYEPSQKAVIYKPAAVWGKIRDLFTER
ncbi:MAG: sulfatase-like hydrolase/transferase [Candidatus Omnitrophota bacterium]